MVPLLDLEGVSVNDFELVRHITRVVVVEGALDFTMNLEINEMCSVLNSGVRVTSLEQLSLAEFSGK